jgi:hypothetical protein
MLSTVRAERESNQVKADYVSKCSDDPLKKGKYDLIKSEAKKIRQSEKEQFNKAQQRLLKQ